MHIAPFLLLALAGCPEPPVATAPSNNENVPVDVLFTHDGCTIYRFKDITYHYFAKCVDGPRPAAMTITTQSCGKSCHYEDEIPTFVAVAH